MNSRESPGKAWTDLRTLIKHEAYSQGFQEVGIVAAGAAEGFDRFNEWLTLGYGGSMQYLYSRRDAYRHPNSILEGVQSIVMLAASYKKPESSNEPSAGFGRVASYATGSRDYHDVIFEKLRGLQSTVLRAFPSVRVRGVVDTAPLLERDFARKAGLGWVGKNTLLLNRRHGSYFFLAALLIDRAIVSDEPFAENHCGTCTACLDACPTQAFPAPYVLDARKCISYLTIEHREAIPLELQEQMGDWLFGCDVCQQVCPWNRKPIATADPDFQIQPDMESLDVAELLRLTPQEFRERYRQTPLWRVKHRGMLRNAMIVAANQKLTGAIPLIREFLTSDDAMLAQTARECLDRISQ